MFSLYNVYLSNLLFYPMIIQNSRNISFNLKKLYIYFAFEIVVILSTVLFIFQYGILSLRTFIQFFFTTQYFILAISNSTVFEKFEKWFRLSGILLGAYIVFMFIFSGQYLNFGYHFFLESNRMWGKDYIPRWPNTIPLSLVFCLWLEMREEKVKWYSCLLLFIAAFLTTSRIGIFGSLIVIAYFLIIKFNNLPPKIKITIGLFIAVVGIIGTSILIAHKVIVIRMIYMGDRMELWRLSIEAIRNRPFLGYGGNTLDVYASIFQVDTNSLYLMQHTHNTFLELIIRYGFLGFSLFFALLAYCYLEIQKPHNKFMFILLILMSLFQIYVRDFIFLIFLLFVIIEGKITNQSSVAND